MNFGTLIAAYFFLFFNFNLGPINIFPDFIGYILLCLGAVEVSRRGNNSYFSVLQKTSLLLLALSLLDLFIRHSSIVDGILRGPSIQGRLFTMILLMTMVSLLLYFFFKLTRGIKEEALKIEEATLAWKADKVFKLYFWFQVIYAVIFSLSILFIEHNTTYELGGAGFFVVIPLFILFIYLFVQVRGLMKLANRKLKTQLPAGSGNNSYS
ncbi:hypothetical protein A8F94_17820 [Bacillus sp. FJAT-27225]|uniref:hypothetical protein n=1 Tax=Bacillus sp. FJAT-27225 TaxID=1743144 RepID=UPI00080C2551|nr:hypothetical protein [Bacillus sp. FJAT-27225]OCA83004.1 hypothetical protein A8F94_17820 [Bacillus sp. FJAT-27225]